MRYPHRMRIYLPGSGELNEDTGRYEPGEDDVRYDGPADVQDEGAVLERAEDGTVTLRSDAQAFPVPAIFDPAQIDPEMLVDILWNPGEVDLDTWDWDADPQQGGADVADAEVLRVVRLDDTVHLRFV